MHVTVTTGGCVYDMLSNRDKNTKHESNCTSVCEMSFYDEYSLITISNCNTRGEWNSLTSRLQSIYEVMSEIPWTSVSKTDIYTERQHEDSLQLAYLSSSYT